MTLFDVTKKNILNNSNNYLIYLISLTFNVAIFFSFQSIIFYEKLYNFEYGSVTMAVGFSSVILAMFTFIFMYYTNHFFFNRRKREIGIYLTLGMRKTQVMKIFIYEIIIIGSISLLLGTTIGFIFSKFIIMILVKLMNQEFIVTFSTNIFPFVVTIFTFILFFIVIGIRSLLYIFNANAIAQFKKNNNQGRNLKFIKLKSIISIILIIYCYYLVYLLNTEKMVYSDVIWIILFLIVTPATFMFFSSVLYFVLKYTKENKNHYYKIENLISISDLTYTFKENSRILSIVSLLVATTSLILSIAFMSYYDIDKITDRDYSKSFIINIRNNNDNDEISNVLNKYKDKNKIVGDITLNLLDVTAITNKVEKINNKKVTINTYMHVMKESEYKKLMRLGNNNIEKLDSKDSVLYITSEEVTNVYYNTKGINTKLDNIDFIIQTQTKDVYLNFNTIKQFMVVSDNMYEKLDSLNNKSKDRLRVINIDNYKESSELSDKLKKSIPYGVGDVNSKIYQYNYSKYIGGAILFIAVALSFVFIICTGSIIFFRQVSTIYDQKERYYNIRQMGANNSKIKKIISKQIKLFLKMPLTMGIFYNIGLLFIIKELFMGPIIIPIAITFITYCTVYFISYFITYKFATNMILGK